MYVLGFCAREGVRWPRVSGVPITERGYRTFVVKRIGRPRHRSTRSGSNYFSACAVPVGNLVVSLRPDRARCARACSRLSLVRDALDYHRYIAERETHISFLAGLRLSRGICMARFALRASARRLQRYRKSSARHSRGRCSGVFLSNIYLDFSIINIHFIFVTHWSAWGPGIHPSTT